MTTIHVAGFDLLADEWDAIVGDLDEDERAALAAYASRSTDDIAYDSYEVVLEAIPGL